ncbi:putative heavy metal-associated domain, HMA, WD40/YVTN repeat-like-containing [Lupinus albus]|uniref:Putative heavy metal-associated domain, HMA, WD40/YVTN repeat-like-containing n=1 Tax=Lupinus albus TaxID=3870 RepID=A0A6A4PAC6_LUPAL|nr:putative heavy metal-associated domain, HMA, WD40/YVTN repeat-like-containing [Lupinus albus]
MSKEEFLKIKKCTLKVNIHCEGCKQKVKKILHKIDGVFTTEIDAEHGKVTVSGNVDHEVLIKKLAKSGKHAELWDVPKPNNNNGNNINPNQLVNQVKNMQIENGKGGGNNKGQNQKGGNGNNQPKGGGGGGGGGGQQGPNPQQQQQLQQQLQQQQQLQMMQQQQLQKLQQLQQMKGFEDLKLPAEYKNMKIPLNQNPNMKNVNLNLPEEDDDFTDDDLDDLDDEDFDDEMDNPANNMKMQMPPMDNGAQMMKMNGMMNPQMMNAQKGAGNGGAMLNGNHPQMMNAQKGENGGGGSQKKGGGGSGGGGGGAVPVQVNGGKKGNGIMGEGVVQPMNNNGMPNMGGGGGGGGGGMNGANVGPMGNMSIPIVPSVGNNMAMNHMASIPSAQGLPAGAAPGGGGGVGGGGGYYPGPGSDVMMAGNPNYQQQYIAAMGNGNQQQLMYARPHIPMNYMYPSPYIYPPPESYNYFNDENTSACTVM